MASRFFFVPIYLEFSALLCFQMNLRVLLPIPVKEAGVVLVIFNICKIVFFHNI